MEGLQPGLDVLGNALGDAQLNPDVKKGLPDRWGRHRSLFSHFSVLLREYDFSFLFDSRHL